MSVLINETYANDTTPLWSRANSSAQASTVLFPDVEFGSFSLYNGEQTIIASCNPALYSQSNVGYMLTLGINIFLDSDIDPSTVNIPFEFILYANNGLGAQYSTTTFIYDLNTSGDAPGFVTISLPFISDGSGAQVGLIWINASDGEISAIFAIGSQSITSMGVPIPIDQIFIPA